MTTEELFKKALRQISKSKAFSQTGYRHAVCIEIATKALKGESLTDEEANQLFIGNTCPEHGEPAAERIPVDLSKMDPGADEYESEQPVFPPTPGKHGYDRTASCGCNWASRLHGNTCPEHGEPAATPPATGDAGLAARIRAIPEPDPSSGWSREFYGGFSFGWTRAVVAAARLAEQENSHDNLG